MREEGNGIGLRATERRSDRETEKLGYKASSLKIRKNSTRL